MSEESEVQEIVVRFWNAVELGFGFGVGLLIANVLVAMAVGIPIGIAWAIGS